MKKEIELDRQKVEYTLNVSKRARRMRLAIYCDGDFVVTVPENVGGVSSVFSDDCNDRTSDVLSSAEQFIIKKSKWVLDKLDFFKNKFAGKVFVKRKRISRKAENINFLKHKETALAFAKERAEHFNKIYGFAFKKISVRNQKTRWGSCSRSGNLSFNYKIVLLPPKIADYIVIHELCHLKEFNHSKNFWYLVAVTEPDYLKCRRELRRGKARVI